MLPYRLIAATGGVHAADQLVFAALPLVATLAGADPAAIGLLVAAQNAAWFVVSLPAGALADRFPRQRLFTGGVVTAGLGALLCLAVVLTGTSLVGLGFAAFIGASGVVLVVLSAFAIMPILAPGALLPRANAANEMARAVVTLAAPSIAAFLVAREQTAAVFAFAAGAAAASYLFARAIAAVPAAPSGREPLLAAIAGGIDYTLRNPLLAAIGACAIFWNLAFLALAALITPLALRVLSLEPQAIGYAWSAYGVGLLLGAFAAPRLIGLASPAVMLTFGPAISVLAALLVTLATPSTGQILLPIAFFLIGFGPMLWLVNQTGLRQRFTPPDRIGRVGATIQFAIYGVRPIGALMAGAAAQYFGLVLATWLPVLLFALSLAAILALLRPALRVIAAGSPVTAALR